MPFAWFIIPGVVFMIIGIYNGLKYTKRQSN